MKPRRIELLAPAKNADIAIDAVKCGADAVYMGASKFGARAAAGNDISEIARAIEFAHLFNAKIYVTVNTILYEQELKDVERLIRELYKIGTDALIVQDMGILRLDIPPIQLHASTQCDTRTVEKAKFLEAVGFSQIVLARELSAKEISDIHDNVSMPLECFIHGALCVSESGLCLFSSYLGGKSANRGMCTQACRRFYTAETNGGFEQGYYFSPCDLQLAEKIPDLVMAGVDSFKIEGRMKSAFYVATIVGAYRKAIDAYYEDPENYKFNPAWLEEVKKVSHRDFTTGFYYGKAGNESQNYASSAYTRDYDFVGKVLDFDETTMIATVEQRNKMVLGDEIEVFGPYTDFWTQKLDYLKDEEGNDLESAPHPQQILKIRMDHPVKHNFMLRKRKEK